jgi:malate permease and related proteins
MELFSSLITSILVLILIIVSVQWLKYRKIVDKTDAGKFSRIVLEYVLPSMIFVNLASQKIDITDFEIGGLVFLSDFIFMIISWYIATLLKLEKARKGAFILVATYGSSTMLGYPLIEQAFPGNALAMTDAIIFSEIGVGLSIFTIGTLVAIYYGQSGSQSFAKAFTSFLKSPVFIALVSGILVSLSGISLPKEYIAPVIKSFNVIAGGLTIFVAIVIGLIINKFNLKGLVLSLAVVVVLKLVLKPILAFYIVKFFGADALAQEIILIQTAMPSATLAAIFSVRYGMDEEYAVNIMLGVMMISLLSVPIMTYLFL